MSNLVIEVGKWYKTRNGKPAYVGYIIPDDKVKWCIQGYIAKDDKSFDCVIAWNKDGMYNNVIGGHDLIEEWKEPKSGVGYVNVYSDKHQGVYYGTMQKTKTEANRFSRCAQQHLIACVRVEWKEGQFDE